MHKFKKECIEHVKKKMKENSEIEFFYCKKRSTLIKVKINGVMLPMQIDTGSEANLIPKTF